MAIEHWHNSILDAKCFNCNLPISICHCLGWPNPSESLAFRARRLWIDEYSCEQNHSISCLWSLLIRHYWEKLSTLRALCFLTYFRPMNSDTPKKQQKAQILKRVKYLTNHGRHHEAHSLFSKHFKWSKSSQKLPHHLIAEKCMDNERFIFLTLTCLFLLIDL